MLTPARFALLAGATALLHSSPTTAARTTSEVVKNYELGPGSQYSSSVSHTFPMPCGSDIKAAVGIMRAGGTSNVDMVLELHSPGSTAGSEGPLVASKQVDATNMMTFHPLSGDKSSLGCNRPWIVRVRTKSGQAPVKIFGSMTVKTALDEVEVEAWGFYGLGPGLTQTVSLGNTQGLLTGELKVEGRWTAIAPVRLRFDLVDPDGKVVATATGYSRLEDNPCCRNDRLLLKHTVSTCRSGQWTIRATNLNTTIGTFLLSSTYASIKLHCPASSSGALSGSLLHVLAGNRAGGSGPSPACG